MEQEAASGILGNLFCCGSIVQDDLGQHRICPSANAAVDVVLDLTGKNVGIRSLGCQDQVDTECTALSGDHGKLAFNLADGLLLLLRQTGFIQDFCNFITGENVSLKILSCCCIVPVNI